MPLPLSLPMKGAMGLGVMYQIIRDDGLCDDIACQHFSSYDKAYAVLERYSRDLSCSDDRVVYRIEEVDPDQG